MSEHSNRPAEKNQYTLKQAPVNIIKGTAIGVGAILPGISGGVLCVVFGIYRPMMDFLSNPIKAFKKYYMLLIPVIIGWAIGFLGLADLVSWMLSKQPAPSVWLFIGLIAGTLPSLFKTAGERGRSVGSWVGFTICFVLFLGWMGFLNMKQAINIEPNFFWWLVCGGLWGISIIVPGLSASSLQMFLGLYQPMTDGIGDRDLSVIIPFAIGVLVIVVSLSRFVNWLFEKAYSMVFHVLLGFVCASTIAIIPINNTPYDLASIAIYAACFIGGFICAFGMDMLGKRLEGSRQKQMGEAETAEE